MSGREAYNNEASQASPISNMRMAYSTDGGAMYAPVMTQPPPSANLSPPPPQQPTYQQPAETLAISPLGMNNVGGGASGGSEIVVKRGRGRPRKYAPDGSAGALGSPRPVAAMTVQNSGGFPSAPAGTPATGKKARGRPPGSVNKVHNKQPLQHVAAAASGLAGVGFTPHIINVKAGEDVLGKLISFSQVSKSAVCLLSANGSISNVTLRQQATSGGTVTYEGRFEILSLCGTFMISESGGQSCRTANLTVSLAGPDGRVLGGGVAGLLTAASPVQIIVGAFMTSNSSARSGQDDVVVAPQTKLPSGTSAGGSLSESSGGQGSPLNLSTSNSHGQGGGMAAMPWR